MSNETENDVLRGYMKQIEITSTGMVFARVFGPDGNLKGSDMFGLGPFSNLDSQVAKNSKRAHKFADARIARCLEFEEGIA